MIYELYYWPTIQGRGEFVRLALEDCGAAYVDVARQTKQGGGIKALFRLLDGKGIASPPFAPPFLKAGKLVIGQTANILLFLGARHRLAPSNEAGRLWAHQLQLTLADFLQEIHDTHHPISGGLYYEDQRAAARRRAADFLAARAPKYLDYFEDILRRNKSGGAYLLGARRSYPDLSLFQIVAGLRYAFPRAMAGLDRRHPRIAAVHDAVASRPRIAAYLASDRRIPFNQQGIFRHYKALDAKPAR
jgi:glutathione S-transferase